MNVKRFFKAAFNAFPMFLQKAPEARSFQCSLLLQSEGPLSTPKHAAASTSSDRPLYPRSHAPNRTPITPVIKFSTQSSVVNSYANVRSSLLITPHMLQSKVLQVEVGVMVAEAARVTVEEVGVMMKIPPQSGQTRASMAI